MYSDFFDKKQKGEHHVAVHNVAHVRLRGVGVGTLCHVRAQRHVQAQRLQFL